ncbi:MAG: hypothetical protein ACI9JN_000842 [Bacteroidia bacterium]|jgi:hypothetical protein
MSFVHPNFLWALSLLAIPIIIHLFHFRRYKKVLFPNVKFLKNVQKQTQSIKKIRNLLVLLARLLAIAFLVFAFAQPYKALNDRKADSSDQVVGIYVDNSFSMDNEGVQGPLIEEAKAKARELVKSYQATDRFIVTSNTTNSLTPVNPEDAIALIDNIEVDKTTKPIGDIVFGLHRNLDNNGVLNKHAYLFSDFQKGIPSDLEETYDSNFLVTAVPAQPIQNSNISIDSAWIESPVIQLNKAVELFVKITNHGDQDLNGGSVALEVNGDKKSVTGFDVTGNTSATVSIGFTVKSGGWQRVKLEIEDNPIIFDDVYFLSFNIKANLNVMVVNGEKANDYLNRLFEPDPYFVLTNQLAGNMDLAVLRTADLVILNEVVQLSSGLIGALSEYVSSGGNILVVPSTLQKTDQLVDLSKNLGVPTIGSRVEQKTKVGKLDLNNPLFDQVFKKIPNNPNYPTVQRYYRLATNGVSYYPLMQMENEDVFLSESKIGTGHYYLLACPLEESWTNFPKHGLFVPTLLKMAMNRSIDYNLANTIENQNIFKAVPESRGLQGELKLVSGETEWMPVINAVGSSPYIDAGFDQITAGNIELKASDSVLQVVAFNYNRSESGSIFNSEADIVTMFPGITVDFMTNPTTYVQETVAKYRFGKQFWKACIILALIFLAIEILLLRFWPTEVKQ